MHVNLTQQQANALHDLRYAAESGPVAAYRYPSDVVRELERKRLVSLDSSGAWLVLTQLGRHEPVQVLA